MRRLRPLLSFLPMILSAQVSAQTLQVRAEGLVAHAGPFTLPVSARYSDAAIAAAPGEDAYILGADLIRSSAVTDQTRLRAGIIDSLAVVAGEAAKHGDDAVAESARRMWSWLRSLPVTGRVAAANLDPRAVEITPTDNLHLADGDVLRYPSRPAGVRIVGAVKAPCDLPFVPLQDALRYLPACAANRSADIETFYIVQPDGSVLKQGRALWNRSEPQALAPGAVLYIPLKASATTKADPDLDHDIAAFLATQVLP